jgi:hypothetical protein
MGLVPFAATMRFENNPAYWEGADACISARARNPRAAWWWNRWMQHACRTLLNCPAASASRTICRLLVKLQRSFVVPPALHRFLTYIHRLDITRIPYMSTWARSFDAARVIGA